MLEIWHENIHNSDSTQRAYNEIYENKGLLQRDSFYLWLIKLLNPVPGKTLMDISCGQGRLVVLAEKQGIRSIGLDFAVEGIWVGKKSSPDPKWLVGDGEILPVADQSVDYVTHIGSLEHYIHPSDGAQEIARILKPGGKACILLPNAFGAFGNIKYVLQHGEIFDDNQPLQRYATYNTWRSLLCKAGMKIDRVYGYGEIDFPRTNKDLWWLLKHPQKIVRGIISHLIPINLANHFVFICSRD